MRRESFILVARQPPSFLCGWRNSSNSFWISPPPSSPQIWTAHDSDRRYALSITKQPPKQPLHFARENENAANQPDSAVPFRWLLKKNEFHPKFLFFFKIHMYRLTERSVFQPQKNKTNVFHFLTAKNRLLSITAERKHGPSDGRRHLAFPTGEVHHPEHDSSASSTRQLLAADTIAARSS